MQPVTIKGIQAAALYAVVAVLVSAALVLSAFRVLVGYAPTVRAQVESALAEPLDRAVSIDALSGRMVGFTPTFELRGVELGDGSDRLAVDSLTVGLSLWGSLLALEPRLDTVTAVGLNLALVRRVGGRLAIPGGEPMSLDEIVLPRRLMLEDANIELRDGPSGRSVDLRRLALRMRRDGRHYRLRVQSRAPRTISGRLELTLTAEATPRRLDDVSVTGYLRWRGAILDRVNDELAYWLPDRLNLPRLQGRADVSTWFSWRDGGLQDLTLAVDGHDWAVGENAMRWSRLSGLARWQLRDDGWRLALDRLRWRRPGEPARPAVSAVLRRDSVDAHDRGGWRGTVSDLRLGELGEWFSTLELLGEARRSQVARLQPSGALRDVRFAWREGETPRWRFAAGLQDIAVTALGAFPGIGGVDGRVVATDRGGEMSLQARYSRLRLPRLLPGPVPFRRITVRGSWRSAGSGVPVRVSVPEIAVDSANGRVSGGVELWLGSAAGAFIDLRARLVDGDGAWTSRYLPAAILPDDRVGWLARAIRRGRVAEARLLLFGPLRAFPFRGGEGLFDMQAHIEDATLAFGRQWPALEKLDGRLRFHNAALHIDAYRGRFLGARLEQGSARVADLETPTLTVDGRFRGTGEEAKRFLQAAPLLEDARVLDDLEIGGSHVLDLSLVFPIAAKAPPRVDGRLRVAQGVLRLPALDLAVESLDGVVRFTEDGLSWDELVGRFAGAPLVSRAATTGEGAEARVRIDARLEASVEALTGGRVGLGDSLRGRTDWLVSVETPGFQVRADRDTRIAVESDLRGLAVDLPGRLAKPAETARAFELVAQLAQGELQPLRLRYGELARLVMEPAPTGDGLRRLGVSLGAGEAELPKAPGTRVTGEWARLSLAALNPTDATPLPARIPALRSVAVEIGEVAAGDYALEQVNVTARREARGWRLELGGPAVAGRVRLPDDAEAQIVADLERLAVRRQPPAKDTDDDTAAVANPPPIDARIATLSVDDRELGGLVVDLRRSGSGLELSRLTLDHARLRLRASGGWRPGGRSRLRFELDSLDVGRALALFGYAETVRGGETHASGELTWEAGLLAPRTALLDGEASVVVRNGSLLAVSPGAGRVFGLLNLSLLPRRLAFDFADVTREGLAFDRIAADFVINDGIAEVDSFVVDGPVARIETTGTIDLVRQRYDQVVRVIPQVSSTLPLLGGLAGGPAGVAILFLAQQVLQAGVDKLTQFSYRVQGKWEDPSIEPIGTPADQSAPGGSDPDRR